MVEGVGPGRKTYPVKSFEVFQPGKKINSDIPEIRRLVLARLQSMCFPLIATHINPDADALGSSIALCIYLQAIGRNPAIFLKPGDKIPKYFHEIIKAEKIRVVNSILGISYDGLVILDAAGKERLEGAVQDYAKSGIKIIDIDHHLGEELVAPFDHTLVTEKISSTAELLIGLLGRLANKNYARAILAGIIADTRNLRLMMNIETPGVVADLEIRGGLKTEDIYARLNEMTAADKALVAELIKTAREAEAVMSYVKYKMLWVAVREESLCERHRNWRRPLQEELGFGRGADIILVIYHDKSQGKYRGSLSTYNSGVELDLRPAAAAISGGGGHPGAVGFDLTEFKDGGSAAELVLKALSDYCKLK